MVSQRAARPPQKRRFKMKKYEVHYEKVEENYRPNITYDWSHYASLSDYNNESLGLFDTYEEAKAVFDATVAEFRSSYILSYSGMRYIYYYVCYIEEGEYDEDGEWDCLGDSGETDFYVTSLPEEEEEDEEEEDEEED